jgi:O-acetyl-ADP-ribose deacetylase (regulator of RNase III)
MPIQYLTGDATQPRAQGAKVIVHCCNNLGAWGSGFVLSLSKRWEEPERRYREWFYREQKPALGEVQFVTVGDDIVVANLIGQIGLRSRSNTRPVQYSAIKKGMSVVADYAKKHNASVHMPRLGCGLAGGSWDFIEPILSEALEGLDVQVYDLP